MNKELIHLGEKISERKTEIAKKVHLESMEQASPEQLKQISAMQESDIIGIRAEFIHMFAEALKNDGVDKEKAYDDIEKWAIETAEFTYNNGFSLDEALKDTSNYRKFLHDVLEEEMLSQNVSIKTAFAVSRVIDPLIDHAVYCFSLTFVSFYKKTLDSAKSAFLELSVPVVPLSKGVAILPLVGDVDTERAHLLMEETLKEAERLKLSNLILDLSGVVMVDTMVADQIFKVMDALKLLGVQTIVTGIRPEIAQTVVSLGLDFSKQVTRANLQQALSDIELFKKNDGKNVMNLFKKN